MVGTYLGVLTLSRISILLAQCTSSDGIGRVCDAPRLAIDCLTCCTKLCSKNSTVTLAGVSENNFWYLCLPYTELEDTASIECLLFNLIFLIFIHLFNFYCIWSFRKKDTKAINIFHLSKYELDIE